MSLFNIKRRDDADIPSAPAWWRGPDRRPVSSSIAQPASSPIGAPAQGASWWRRGPYQRDERVVAGAQDAAYVDGARDQQRLESDVERRAYRQGELDGRRLEARRRRGHPLLATLVFLIALAGVGYGYLSFEQGSFSGGGAVIDGKIAQLRGEAGQAGVASGQAVQNAGADITAHGQALTQSSATPVSSR